MMEDISKGLCEKIKIQISISTAGLVSLSVSG